mmetsp:Transcript_25148/g.54300  ORF Transcript_25148/g.54300 Transcript_25148/m.54300 type:complete len:350 (-) Transcript_25148:232-1281(-)
MSKRAGKGNEGESHEEQRGEGAKMSPLAEKLYKILPILLQIEGGIEKFVSVAHPIYLKACEKYKQVYEQMKPYGPDQLIKIAIGIAMMFFGGFFITTVAVAEAFDQGGRTQLLKNLKVMQGQAQSVRRANSEDDKIDADGDGIADVKQISKKELSMRKMGVFLRAVDPQVLSSTLSNLYSIFMAVLATLQIKFARSISLGASIGNILANTARKFIVPPLKEVVGEEYHNWVPVVTNYICRMIGISIAFAVTRVLSTIHTAIRGARLATDGFTEWCEARGLNYLTDGYVDDAVAFVLAGLGIYGQLFIWSELPILIKLIMFPFSIVESLLSMLVSASVTASTAHVPTASG